MFLYKMILSSKFNIIILVFVKIDNFLYLGDSRYVDNNRTPGGWHSGPPTKSFNSVQSGGARDPRNETSGWSGRSSDNVNR